MIKYRLNVLYALATVGRYASRLVYTAATLDQIWTWVHLHRRRSGRHWIDAEGKPAFRPRRFRNTASQA